MSGLSGLPQEAVVEVGKVEGEGRLLLLGRRCWRV